MIAFTASPPDSLRALMATTLVHLEWSMTILILSAERPSSLTFSSSSTLLGSYYSVLADSSGFFSSAFSGFSGF